MSFAKKVPLVGVVFDGVSWIWIHTGVEYGTTSFEECCAAGPTPWVASIHVTVRRDTIVGVKEKMWRE